MFKILFGSPVRFIEFIIVAAMLVTFISQVILPLIRNRPIFPIFSRKPKLAKEIASVKEEMDEEEMKSEIARLKGELKKKKAANEDAWMPPPPAKESTASSRSKPTTNKPTNKTNSKINKQ